MDPESDYVNDSIARVRKHLEAYRSGAVDQRPAGRFVRPGLFWVVLLVTLGVVWLAAAFAMLRDSRPGDPDQATGVFAALFALPFLIVAVWFSVISKADTPKRALKLYFGCLGAGAWKKARKLVLRTDLDDFPRYQPFVENLGNPTPDDYRFETPLSYEQYWGRLLRTHPWPYCRAQVSNLNLTEVTPDVLVADFRLTVTMNTSLYALLILLGCIGILAALIVDAVTRKVVKADLRKVLVRVEDEWHLLNGAWWEHDEADISWLTSRS